MGLLDDLKTQAEGLAHKLAGDHPQLAQEVTGLVHGGPGGLAGLVQLFKNNGLGHLMQSWVGTGPNQPITAQQIQQALGGDRVRQIATRHGIDPNLVAQKLSTILPQVVNHLTPHGQLPAAAPKP